MITISAFTLGLSTKKKCLEAVSPIWHFTEFMKESRRDMSCRQGEGRATAHAEKSWPEVNLETGRRCHHLRLRRSQVKSNQIIGDTGRKESEDAGVRNSVEVLI